jgi:ureidoacrylate peracid hydrolase
MNPENNLPSALSPSKTVVLLIDMQNEFVRKGACMAVPGAEELSIQMNSFAQKMRCKGFQIIWVRYAVPKPVPYGKSTQRLNLTDIHHGENMEIFSMIKPDEDDLIVDKMRSSAFYGTNLEVILRSLKIKNLIIGGLTTHMCVLSTCFDAVFRDFEIFVLSDLTACLEFKRENKIIRTAEEMHGFALDLIAYGLGKVIVTSDLTG